MIFSFNFFLFLRFVCGSRDCHNFLSNFLKLIFNCFQLFWDYHRLLSKISLPNKGCWRSDSWMGPKLQNSFCLTQWSSELSCFLCNFKRYFFFTFWVDEYHLANIIRLKKVHPVYCLKCFGDCWQLQNVCFSYNPVKFDLKL